MLLEHSKVTAPAADATDPWIAHGKAKGVAAHDQGNCTAVAPILSRVGDKWSMLVVMTLAEGPRRFNALKREIQGISQRMLTLTLRQLERDGMVTRTVHATVPPSVDYALTDLGRSLCGPVVALCEWAIAHHGDVVEARADYDARAGE